jgi:hypothetical protein
MATKARLHWFWRGAIATLIGAGCLCAFGWLNKVAGYPVASLVDEIGYAGRRIGIVDNFDFAVWFFIWGLPTSFGTLLADGLLTRWLGSHADGELHCRKCGYILRGISEPRCPECGEAI